MNWVQKVGALVLAACGASASVSTDPPAVPAPSQDLAAKAYAETNSLPVDKVEVQVLEHPAVDGTLVFRAYHREDNRPMGWAVGVVQASGVTWGTKDALAAVLDVWGGGMAPNRSAVDVAAVAGFLEVQNEPTNPLLAKRDASHIKADWAKKIRMPSRTPEQVVYWNTSAEPPLWQTTITRDASGVKLSKVSIWDMN